MRQSEAKSEQFRRTKATMARKMQRLKSKVSALFKHIVSSATMDFFFSVFLYRSFYWGYFEDMRFVAEDILIHYIQMMIRVIVTNVILLLL